MKDKIYVAAVFFLTAFVSMIVNQLINKGFVILNDFYMALSISAFVALVFLLLVTLKR